MGYIKTRVWKRKFQLKLERDNQFNMQFVVLIPLNHLKFPPLIGVIPHKAYSLNGKTISLKLVATVCSLDDRVLNKAFKKF